MISLATDDSSAKPNIFAVVPAAGYGRRMGIGYPKQYYLINKKTVIEYTIETLLTCSKIKKIIVSISPEDHYFHTLPISNNIRVSYVLGGLDRARSVMSALQIVENKSWVLIHDAVRPCLRKNDLNRLLKIYKTSQVGGVLAVPVKDTIRYFFNKKTVTLNRKNLWHVLTPQFFPRNLLFRCLAQALKEKIAIPDDFSSLEKYGFFPKKVLGHSDNIKITYPTDLSFVEYFLKKRKG